MATRSRYGCATCRKRKKKCDEGRPQCGQCVSRGVQCGGYDMRLTWGNGVASRGRFAGSTFAFPDMVRNGSTGTPSPQSAASIGSPITILEHDTPGATTTAHQDSPHSSIPSQPSPQARDRQSLTYRNEEERDVILKNCECSCFRGSGFSQRCSDSQVVLNEGIHRLYATTACESIVEAFKDLMPTSEVLTLICVALQEVISTGPTVSALEKTARALEMFRHQVSLENFRSQEELFMTGAWICTLHVSHLTKGARGLE